MNTRINLKQLPSLWPHNIQWSYFFAYERPLDLEIGCGRPHFFFDRAKNLPERNIIGIEWKYEFVEQARRRIVREQLSNALAFHGNAWLLVPMLFRPKSIETIFVNFPDPWWKGRHKKRLVLNEVFLNALQARTAANGAIVLQTDVRELFDFYRELINQHGAFKLDSSMSHEQIIAQNQAHTHREKKCLAQSLAIYRGLFRAT